MNDNSELSLFSDDELRESKEKMRDFRLDKEDTHLHIYDMELVDRDFRRYSMQRSQIRGSKLKNTNFGYAAATGSRFIDTLFEDCALNNASFQCCDLIDVIVHSTDRKYITGSNFSQSNIVSSCFDNIRIKASTFSQCYFLDSGFKGCRIRSCTFENSIFDSCRFIDTDMVRLNMEFIKFKKGNEFDNVELSMHQIPYMIGFKDPLDNGKNVHAVSYKIGCDNKASKLSYSWPRYKDMLMDMAKVYYSSGELYPVANILFNLGDTKGAHSAVMEGLRKSLIERDFRMVRHFCDIGTEYGLLDREDKMHIGSLIADSMRSEQNMEVVNKYLIYSGEIQSKLDRDGSMDELNMTVYTRIDSNDRESIQLLIDELMRVLNDAKQGNDKYSIRIAHNCDLDVFIQIFTDHSQDILNILYSFFGNVAYGGYRWLRSRNGKSNRQIDDDGSENSKVIERGKETVIEEDITETKNEEGLIVSCIHRVITTKEYERETLIGRKDYRSAERPRCSDTCRMGDPGTVRIWNI